MSSKLAGRCWDLCLPTEERTVLMAMCECTPHGEGRDIFVGVERIAWMTDMSDRNVRRIQKKLEERGVLVVVKEAVQWRPKEYAVNWKAVPSKGEYFKGILKQAGQNVRSGDGGENLHPEDEEGQPSAGTARSRDAQRGQSVRPEAPAQTGQRVRPAGSPDLTNAHSRPDKCDSADLTICPPVLIEPVVEPKSRTSAAEPRRAGAGAPAREAAAPGASRENAGERAREVRAVQALRAVWASDVDGRECTGAAQEREQRIFRAAMPLVRAIGPAAALSALQAYAAAHRGRSVRETLEDVLRRLAGQHGRGARAVGTREEFRGGATAGAQAPGNSTNRSGGTP